MSFNLNQCTSDCTHCVQSYINKFRLEKGDKFQIKCFGIPKSYIPEELIDQIEDQDATESILNPVKWAAKYLDWHCIDPDGSVWKRKTEEGTLKEVHPYNEELALAGKSPYHRPYQALMLACSSRRKVFRCVDGSTTITIKNGSVKQITELKPGEEIVSINETTLQANISKVLNVFKTEIKDRFEVTTKFGHKVIVSRDHPFLTKQERVDKKNKYFIENIQTQWQSINTGLTIGSRIAICNHSSVQNIQDNNLIKYENCITWDYIKTIKQLPKK
jgi:hypothetical protein